MKVFMIQYGGEDKSPPYKMYMIIISYDRYEQPQGYQVWPDIGPNVGGWVVDNVSTTVTRPIIKAEEVGTVKRIWT